MEIVGMNKKERRANIEEGIEIYMKNTRAELDDLDAKAAAEGCQEGVSFSIHHLTHSFIPNRIFLNPIKTIDFLMHLDPAPCQSREPGLSLQKETERSRCALSLYNIMYILRE